MAHQTCVFTAFSLMPKNFFDSQMLLDPLEEQFNLPAVHQHRVCWRGESAPRRSQPRCANRFGRWHQPGSIVTPLGADPCR